MITKVHHLRLCVSHDADPITDLVPEILCLMEPKVKKVFLTLSGNQTWAVIEETIECLLFLDVANVLRLIEQKVEHIVQYDVTSVSA